MKKDQINQFRKKARCAVRFRAVASGQYRLSPDPEMTVIATDG